MTSAIDKLVHDVLNDVTEVLEQKLARPLEEEVRKWAEEFLYQHPRPRRHHHATSLQIQIRGGKHVPTFTINTTDGEAELQLTDADGNPVAGPNDSVTGDPVVPVVTSDTDSVLTVAVAVAGTTAGSWSAALTPVAVGAANVGVAALTNSDGSPVLETAGPNEGQPFSVPPSVEVTVEGGVAEGLTLAVTG